MNSIKILTAYSSLPNIRSAGNKHRPWKIWQKINVWHQIHMFFLVKYPSKYLYDLSNKAVGPGKKI